MIPPLSKEIWFNEDIHSVRKLEFKQWNGSQRSLFYEPDEFYLSRKDLLGSENGGVAVAVARGWAVSHLDIVNKTAYLNGGHEIKCGKCLISTGATPKQLSIIENSDPRVRDVTTTYRNIYDFEALYKSLANSQSVAIIGGGFLGSELACAFGQRTKKDSNFKVYQIFREGGNMGKVLPEYLSYWTTEKIKGEGVNVRRQYL